MIESEKNLGNFKKPEYTFLKDKMSLTVPFKNIGEVIVPVEKIIEDGEYRIKKEFHITLITFPRGREIKAHLQNNNIDMNQAFLAIKKLLDVQQFSINPTNEYYHLKKEFKQSEELIDYRESIINIVTIPELKDFWKKLQDVIGMDIPEPFMHVTLATRGTGSPQVWDGIAVKDKADFDQLEKEKLIV